MTLHPLEDPNYQPAHPPHDGIPPMAVAQWGPRSQLRWFTRYRGELIAQPTAVWDRFYCVSLEHRGLCCESCLQDDQAGVGGDLPYCCCKAIP